MELDTRWAKEKAESARMFLAGFADDDFGEFAAPDPFCHRYLAAALDHIEELSAMVLNLADRVPPNDQASGARSVPLDAPVGRGKD